MASLNIKKWSIKQKVSAFAIMLVCGGGAILALTVGSQILSQNYNKKAKIASEVNRLLNLMETDYYEMTLGLITYISSNDTAWWDKKLRADQAAIDHFTALSKLNYSEDVKPYIAELDGFDQKHLDPVDLQIKALIDAKNSKEELLAFYKEKYLPLTEKVSGLLTDASMITENDMEVADALVQRISRAGAWITGLAIFFGTIFGFVSAWFMGSWLGGTLEGAIDRLEKESAKAKKATGEVSEASQMLASAATEQAAALQETAASIEEMSAMITKSSENASQSGQMANSAVDVANRGKHAVAEMIQAIREINESNSNIMIAVEESNRKITEITKVISEIGNKTKVINDIVFQTKLLSFNASVEAARAGEHGKGFAVVAEEVGNLAQMSGNAAKEIGSMLDSSITKVEGIVTETKTKVERLIAEGKTKVETGTELAEGSGKVLDDILDQVNRLNTMVGEISTAASEQAQGVSEITKAMSQLDSVTQQNTSTSAQIASNAEQMAGQTQALRAVVHQLEDVIYGEGMRNTSSTRRAALQQTSQGQGGSV